MGNRFANIDEKLKASDIVKMLEQLYEKSEANYRNNIRSDGFAKRGKSTAVLAASQGSYVARTVLDMIEAEIKRR